MKRKAYERNRRLAGQNQQPIYKRKRMKKMSVQITEQDFKEYVKVQESGDYNMFTEMDTAITETNLSKEQWFKIMKHYETFYNAWITKEFNTDEI